MPRKSWSAGRVYKARTTTEEHHIFETNTRFRQLPGHYFESTCESFESG